MSVAQQANDRQSSDGELIRRATELLSQQIWCWGQDILRPQGNWLLEIGFDRIEPPAEREECSSVYALELPEGRCVVLRGFGAFFGDRQCGGIFLPRFKFRPQYTTLATLDRPPWSDADLPKLSPPNSSQKSACRSLTLNLIDWIRRYEMNIVERLGIEYRRETLAKWENGSGRITPVEEMARAWQMLGVAVAADFQALIPRRSKARSYPYA